MREILFKAKQIDNGEWIEGSLIDLDIDSGYCYIVQPYKKASILPIIFLITDRMKLVGPETICQFTGLCDKNGKKIWENDIVLITENVYSTVKFGLYHEAGKSERTHQGFYLESMDKYYYREELGYWAKESVVVGNIFDNKELLQEGSDE